MKKRYLVSDDEFSGKVVITCETKEEDVDIHVPTTDEMNAAMYLYREIPKHIVKKTLYVVKVFYHYELGENAYLPDGDGCTNLLERWATYDKNEANEYFKHAVAFCK